MWQFWSITISIRCNNNKNNNSPSETTYSSDAPWYVIMYKYISPCVDKFYVKNIIFDIKSLVRGWRVVRIDAKVNILRYWSFRCFSLPWNKYNHSKYNIISMVVVFGALHCIAILSMALIKAFRDGCNGTPCTRYDVRCALLKFVLVECLFTWI